MVGLLCWLTCDPAQLPTAESMHGEVIKMKNAFKTERMRMPPNTVPYYMAMPGPAEFYAKHQAEYLLAWGTNSGPPSGLPEYPHSRTAALAVYLTRGVPLQRRAVTVAHMSQDRAPPACLIELGV